MTLRQQVHNQQSHGDQVKVVLQPAAIHVWHLSSLSFSHDASSLPQVSPSSVGPGRLTAHPPRSLTHPGTVGEVQGMTQEATTIAISVERVSNQLHST